MGTRHLTCVKKNKEFKVAQYGQWDGYPTGQGVDILDNLQSFHMSRFVDRIEQVKSLTEDEVNALWVECGADPASSLVSVVVAEEFKKKYPSLYRDTGANILRIIYENNGGVPVHLSTEFAADGLFCEWAYVIDLDDNTLTVYRGFNQDSNADMGHFDFLKDMSYKEHRGDDQYLPPVRVKVYSLDDLPDKKEFSDLEDSVYEDERVNRTRAFSSDG